MRIGVASIDTGGERRDDHLLSADFFDAERFLGGVQQVASFQTDLRIDETGCGVGAGSWAAAVIVGHAVDIDIAVEASR